MWGGGGGPRASRLWNLASPLFHDLATTRAAVDRYIGQADCLVDIRACQPLRRRDSDPLGWVDLTVLDGFPEEQARSLAFVVGAYYRSRCELDGAVTMLALAEYRRRLGAYPDRLDQLVPDFLPRLPIDYADMQPLRYRRENDDYVLYGIGLDGEDGGGKHAEEGYSWSQQLDAVFSAARRPEVTE
jgi:hypothetical protein